MKIVMLTVNILGRGTYLRAFRFAVELAQLGHEVTLIATKPSGRSGISVQVENSVRIVTFPDLFTGPLRSGWDPSNWLRRIYWLRNMEFDVVHAFETRPTVIYPALFLKRKGAALVMDWCDWFGRGGAVEERPNPLIRTVLRPVETYFEEHFRTQASETTVICSTLFDRVVRLGQPTDTVTLLPNGFDMPELKSYDLRIARGKLNLPQNDYLIGYVGSGFQRDVQLMEEAFNILVEEIPNAKLVHVGRSTYAISPRVKHAEKILFTGEVDDEKLSCYLSACDICWLPLKDSNANRGRFPLKLATYLAAGRPVVASAVGDLVSFFEQYNVGLLSIDEPAVIAEKSLLLYQSPQLRSEMSRNARMVGQNEQLTWKQRAKELEQIYRRASGNRRAPHL